MGWGWTDFWFQYCMRISGRLLIVCSLSNRCMCRGLPNPSKLYAVKLLFNFTHEYSSVIRNTYENEWLVLSRLLPHDNIIRFWAQFISTIPDPFAQLLPEDIKKLTTYKTRAGAMARKKGQFLILDYHPQDMCAWTSKVIMPIPYEKTLKFTEQLLEAALYLQKCLIHHLDMKMSNLLMAENERVVLCDFGCAVRFSDDSFALGYIQGMLPGGNKAHLAPEVLNGYHRCKLDPAGNRHLSYSRQASFAVGVLAHEIATGGHPLPDYPLGYTTDGIISYSTLDIASLPVYYPKSYCSIITDLLHADPLKRLSVSEALKQLHVCCMRRQSGASLHVQTELERTRQERDVAKVSTLPQ